MKENRIVTISRQYGSGGREIGKKLAARLGIPYYDKELIILAAEKSGYARSLFEEADQIPDPEGQQQYDLLPNAGGLHGEHLRYAPER